MLMPKRVKHRKQQRGRMGGSATRGAELAFGDFGLKALEPGWVTNTQIEPRVSRSTAMSSVAGRCGSGSSRQARDREARRDPHGQRQGQSRILGCGRETGRILFELEGITAQLANEALRLGASKLPIKTKIVHRQEY